MRGRKAGAAVLAAAVTLAVAAIASGAGVIPATGGFLGGGSIEAKYRPGFHPKLAWIDLAVSRDGKTVTAYGDWNASCTGFGPPARASFTTKPFTPRADGSFVAVGELSPSNTAGHYALTGHFTSATSATGTGQSQFTFAAPDGKKHDCSTGNVKWQARDDSRSAAGGKPALRPGSVYYGNTHGPNGRLPLVLRVASDGKSIEEAAALVDARCTKDTKYFVHVDPIFARVKVASNGTFASSPAYTDSLLGRKLGEEGRVTMAIKGKFGRTTVSGTWQAKVKIELSASGAVLDTCSSGPLTFKAAR